MTYLNVKYDKNLNQVIINYSEINPSIIFSKNCVFVNNLYEYKFYKNYYTIQYYSMYYTTKIIETCKYPLILDRNEDEYLSIYLKSNSNEYLKFDKPNDKFKYFNIYEEDLYNLHRKITTFDDSQINIVINENNLLNNYEELYNEFEMFGETDYIRSKFDINCYCYL